MTLIGSHGVFAAALVLFMPGTHGPASSSNLPGTAESASEVTQPVDHRNGERRHLRLIRSEPASDTTIAQSPEEIRLYFSEAPQISGSTVRLTAGADRLVETTETAGDKDHPSQLFIRPISSLPTGLYTVHWRVMARDGHALRGTFEFGIEE
ncbi:MAG: copper resistance CopC family protein [Gemmatimonadota bacterium]